jgi:hypothetical protein
MRISISFRNPGAEGIEPPGLEVGNVNTRIVKVVFAAAVALAIPSAVVLAHGPGDAQKGLSKAATHAQHGLPSAPGQGPNSDGNGNGNNGNGNGNGNGNNGNGDNGNGNDGNGNDEDGNNGGNGNNGHGNGNRPHNHGWYVSQAARDSSTTGSDHGEAVSTVAQSDVGKP